MIKWRLTALRAGVALAAIAAYAMSSGAFFRW
jgi:hypothetical protein